MNNIEQFSLYTAQILDILFESFPVPCNLDRSEITKEYLRFDKHESLKKLKNEEKSLKIHLDAFEAFQECFEEDVSDTKDEISKELHPIKDKVTKLEENKKSDNDKQQSILNGTIEFLSDEGLIKVVSPGKYRLTSKSFSHLNREFKNSSIKTDDSSYIKAIKSIFPKSANAAEKVAIGVAIKVIPEFLGIS
ncbi:hypothetical protein [Marinobacterium jannaschii]|uniref:hypothetical protein n=1 Tax=Marinobacterium jannaschii TaxID=64970 RepID=UPI00048A19BC|nr:hypothetical protein [Marinobacterium jannaschii]